MRGAPHVEAMLNALYDLALVADAFGVRMRWQRSDPLFGSAGGLVTVTLSKAWPERDLLRSVGFCARYDLHAESGGASTTSSFVSSMARLIDAEVRA